MELYALDGNLNPVGFVEYESLIWIERYNRVGSCEVYAPLTDKNKEILVIGNYLCRSDNFDMVCRIRDAKIKNDADTGSFITALGLDSKYYLDSRINTTLDVFNSYESAGSDLDTLVWQVLTTQDADRALKTPHGNPLFVLRTPTGLGGTASQSIMGMSWGAIVRQILGSMDCGYMVHLLTVAGVNRLEYLSRKGTEKNVWFSRTFDNLGEIDYEADSRNIGNSIYIKDTENDIVGLYVVGNPYITVGTWEIDGAETGTERYERIIETGSLRSKTYGSIKAMVEGTWTLVQSGDDVIIHASNVYLPILSRWQDNRNNYPGAWSSRSIPYWHVYSYNTITVGRATNTQVADVTDDTNFEIDLGPMYDYVLMCAAVEESRNYEKKETVDTEIVNNRFAYRTDYNLGDVVNINAFGTTQKARIVEVLECWDENGYHLEPRTSYTDVDQE